MCGNSKPWENKDRAEAVKEVKKLMAEYGYEAVLCLAVRDMETGEHEAWDLKNGVILE